MSERVTLRIDGETKEQWQEVAEERRQYENLSHMVKLAVHREIHGQDGPAEGDGGYIPETTNGELMDAIRDLQGDVNKVAGDVELIQDEVTGHFRMEPPDGFLDAIPEGKVNAVTERELQEDFPEVPHSYMAELLADLKDIDHIKTTIEEHGSPAFYKV